MEKGQRRRDGEEEGSYEDARKTRRVAGKGRVEDVAMKGSEEDATVRIVSSSITLFLANHTAESAKNKIRPANRVELPGLVDGEQTSINKTKQKLSTAPPAFSTKPLAGILRSNN
ncbi:hypothetical protein ACH5RR_035187 [Cinchona calisaya]|uniref:Uncharacterized protein n=1 Tax=Cinchona calisaya TaxID=153742 RepID=A0ABD2YF70_9GENT